MRIDHLLVTAQVAERVVWSEIDREARKGPPIPSDHAPLVLDLDTPGRPFDPDWAGALVEDRGAVAPGGQAVGTALIRDDFAPDGLQSAIGRAQRSAEESMTEGLPDAGCRAAAPGR